MITPGQEKAIQAYLRRKATGETYQQLAEHFGVSVSRMTKMLAWCRKQNVHGREVAATVEARILETKALIQKLERQLDNALRRADQIFARREALEKMIEEATEKGDVEEVERLVAMKKQEWGPGLLSPKYFVPIAEEIRENRILLMELEGIYGKAMNITINNNIEKAVVYLPRTESREEWQKMADSLRAVAEVRG